MQSHSQYFRHFVLTSMPQAQRLAELAKLTPTECEALRLEILEYQESKAIGETSRVAPCSGRINVIGDGAGGGIIEFVGDTMSDRREARR